MDFLPAATQTSPLTRASFWLPQHPGEWGWDFLGVCLRTDLYQLNGLWQSSGKKAFVGRGWVMGVEWIRWWWWEFSFERRKPRRDSRWSPYWENVRGAVGSGKKQMGDEEQLWDGKNAIKVMIECKKKLGCILFYKKLMSHRNEHRKDGK